MRYSLIHHDIREKYGLNLNQYAVADSIHQLSHRGPTTRPNTVIAAFLGLDEATVRRAKSFLIEKGLIEQTMEGVQTTPVWYQEVVRQKSEYSAKSREPRNSAESHLISKEVKKDIGTIVPPTYRVQKVKTDKGGNEVEEKENRSKKTADPDWPLYRAVLAMVEKEAGFAVATTAWDFKAVKKARALLGEEKHVKWLVEEVLQNQGHQKHSYSLSRILGAGNINSYKADL